MRMVSWRWAAGAENIGATPWSHKSRVHTCKVANRGYYIIIMSYVAYTIVPSYTFNKQQQARTQNTGQSSASSLYIQFRDQKEKAS